MQKEEKTLKHLLNYQTLHFSHVLFSAVRIVLFHFESNRIVITDLKSHQ